MADRISASSDLARRRFAESYQWWLQFDIHLYQYRAWLLTLFARTQIRMRRRRRSPAIDRQIAEARAQMNTAYEQLWMSARCAVAAELAGRIYDEDCEGRETILV